MPLASVQNIAVNTLLVGDILVLHQSCLLLLKLSTVQLLLLKLVVQLAPGESLHLAAVVREGGLCPTHHRLEVEPERIGVGFVLIDGLSFQHLNPAIIKIDSLENFVPL